MTRKHGPWRLGRWSSLAGIAAASLAVALSGCGSSKTGSATDASKTTNAKSTIVMMPKIIGIPYYKEVDEGINQFAKTVPGTTFDWTGPSDASATDQISEIQALIAQHPKVIAIAADDPKAVVPVLKKAENAGIKVMSWDAQADTGSLFVQIVDPSAFGTVAVDKMAKLTGGSGQMAVITSALTATPQEYWLASIRKEIAAKYPGMHIVQVLTTDETESQAYQDTVNVIHAYPNLKGIFAIDTGAPPSVAAAVDALGMKGKVAIIGNSQPSLIKQYFANDTLKYAELWNPIGDGYVSACAAYQLATKGIKNGQTFTCGKWGKYKVTAGSNGLEITFSSPLVFTSKNIDNFDF